MAAGRLSVTGNRTMSLPIAAESLAPDRLAVHDRGWLMRRMLLVADLVALSTSFVLVDLIYRSDAGPHDAVALNREFLLFFLSLPCWIVLAKLYGLYDLDEERADHSTADELFGVFHLVTVGAFVFYAVASVTRLVEPIPAKIVTFWALAVVAMTCGRGLARIVSRRQGAYVQRTVIVGAGDVGQLIARKVAQHREYGMDVVGFVDSAPKDQQAGLGELKLLGTPDDLPALVESRGIDRVIVAFSNDGHEQTLDLIRTLAALDVCIDVVPRLFPVVGQSVGVHSIEGLSLVALPRVRLSRSTLLLKRSVDVSVALVSLILLSPVLALFALRIKRDSPGPVFFRQTRIGAGGDPFRMFKFRTMRADADARKDDVAGLNKHAHELGDTRMFKVPDDPRVTSFGRFLRRYSLDELPQLINVLRGEMSLVGPRPLIPDEDRHVTDWRRRRLLVRPGMTGPWQVLGRDDLSFEEMVELDYRYVAGWSLVNDLSLVLRTFPAIVRERAAY